MVGEVDELPVKIDFGGKFIETATAPGVSGQQTAGDWPMCALSQVRTGHYMNSLHGGRVDSIVGNGHTCKS